MTYTKGLHSAVVQLTFPLHGIEPRKMLYAEFLPEQCRITIICRADSRVETLASVSGRRIRKNGSLSDTTIEQRLPPTSENCPGWALDCINEAYVRVGHMIPERKPTPS